MTRENDDCIGDRQIEASGGFRSGERVICCIVPNVTLSTDWPENKASARKAFHAGLRTSHLTGFFTGIDLDCGL